MTSVRQFIFLIMRYFNSQLLKLSVCHLYHVYWYSYVFVCQDYCMQHPNSLEGRRNIFNGKRQQQNAPGFISVPLSAKLRSITFLAFLNF